MWGSCETRKQQRGEVTQRSKEAPHLYQKCDCIVFLSEHWWKVRFGSSIQLSYPGQGQGCTCTVALSECDDQRGNQERMVTHAALNSFQGYPKPRHQGILISMGFQSLTSTAPCMTRGGLVEEEYPPSRVGGAGRWAKFFLLD